MKLRFRFGAAAILTASLALSGCFGGQEEDQTENAAADGVLTVGIIPGNDIFCFAQEGSGTMEEEDEGLTGLLQNIFTPQEAGDVLVSGIEPQLMEALGKSLGVQVKFQTSSSLDGLLSSLDAGQVDVAIGRIAQADAYGDQYQVSRNYAKKGIYLLTRKYDYTDTLGGYAETAVGISSSIPSNVRAEIPDLDQVTVQEYMSLEDAVEDLLEENISAVIVNEREAMSEISSTELQAQEMLNGPKESYVALMGAGQQELAASLNQVIREYLDNQAAGGEAGGQAQEETLPEQPGEEE